MKLDTVQKIALTGILTALVIIFTRFFSIQNIPIMPFVRISLGPALIILSSILLGPVYGACVGAASDILGIILRPNELGYSINPLFTLVYGLLGLLPGLIILLIKKVQNEKLLIIINIITLGLLWVFISIFTIFDILVTFEIYQKILIVSISLLLMVGTFIGIFFINKYVKKKSGDRPLPYSVYHISFVSLIVEFFVLSILNSVVKAYMFEVSFLLVFFSQSIVFFINIAIDSLLVSYLLYLASRILRPRGELNG